VATDARDPRSIVTPAAFEIDSSLLGLPLAAPSQRLWAMLIDLGVVAILTGLLDDLSLLVWAAIALVLVRVALKRTGKSMSQAAGMVLRTSAGCLGVSILSIVLIVLAFARMGSEDREAALEEVIERGTSLASPEMRADIADMDLGDAETPDEALRELVGGARRMRELPAPVRRQLLRAAVPADAPWAGQADSLVALAIERTDEGRDTADARPASADSLDGRAISDLEDAEVLTALAAEERSATPDPARLAALRARTTAIVAADTIEALRNEVEDLQGKLGDERDAKRDIEQELEKSRTGFVAFAGLLRDLWGQVGSAIGLWSLYFTVLLTVGRGRTIGKRIMRVRALRLDGQPIGWWSAFERAGGYAAGLATGFLGFAQVLWDPNRQCIHDKIAGTVVVVDGAERAAWEEAWLRRTKQ
jgi:hypothetical protein